VERVAGVRCHATWLSSSVEAVQLMERPVALGKLDWCNEDRQVELSGVIKPLKKQKFSLSAKEISLP